MYVFKILTVNKNNSNKKYFIVIFIYCCTSVFTMHKFLMFKYVVIFCFSSAPSIPGRLDSRALLLFTTGAFK